MNGMGARVTRVTIIYDGFVYQIGSVTYRRILERIAAGQPVKQVMRDVVQHSYIDADFDKITASAARRILGSDQNT